MADRVSVNKDRILAEFFKLTSFDAPSYQEEGIAKYLKEKLKSLGLSVEEDDTKSKLLEEDASRTKTASNLYAYLKGTGDPILFSSHMDTVNPGIGKKAILHDDGRITSAGNTVLGADDVSGLVSIIEALTVIQEKKIPHPDLEILFTVAEEPYCSGSRFIDYKKIKAKEGYVLDLTGPVGTAATAAPSILSLKIGVKGRAAHAGFNPEKGINALSIAADALANVRTGRVYENLTVNFGTISGGSGRNIVPEAIWIEGEIRCLEHEKALCEADLIREIFEKAAKKYGGAIEFGLTEHIRSYGISKRKNVVKRFLSAAKEVTTLEHPETITTYGGSDANRLNEHNVDTIIIANAMENSHGTDEYTTAAELTRSAELTLRLMTSQHS
ncbi:MAG: M20/M25/M40 family metallo-hydrolase [Lachnospiraceae bacterium]|nr:M20/M25/M40 family metallo-hydrolase [Lachnospiraceae bacterium]